MDDELKKVTAALYGDCTGLTPETVDALYRRWPYFTVPALMELKGYCGSVSDDRRRELMARVALNSSDPAAMAELTDTDSELWRDFYPSETGKKISTEETISTFLDTYGHSSPEEDRLLERLIFNPVPDYSTMLAREEEESQPDESEAAGDSPDALINSFILRSRQEGHFPSEKIGPESIVRPQPITLPEETPVEPREPVNDSSLSESLAKIYIKQRRYDKAYEIISSLSLNNPKKSVYFADQLRFLRKLMLNNSYRNSENTPQNN